MRNYYFEGGLPRVNPAWKTAKSRIGDHLASPPGSRRPQNDNYNSYKMNFIQINSIITIFILNYNSLIPSLSWTVQGQILAKTHRQNTALYS